MSRGIGEIEAVYHLIPDWLAVIAGLITQLGDVWFLGLILGLLYLSSANWQDDLAAAWGVYLIGLGTYSGLKEFFALPRPMVPLRELDLPSFVQSLYDATATATGYGFPSGHATNATVVYLGLALLLPIGTRRQRLLGAVSLALLIGFSRVVLGLHYLVDILGGFLTGGLVLLIGLRLLARVPIDRETAIFGLAVVMSSVNVVMSDGKVDSLLLLGATLGAFAGWQLVIATRVLVGEGHTPAARRSIQVRGGSAILAFLPLIVGFDAFSILTWGAPGQGGALGVLVVIVFATPLIRYSPRGNRLLTAYRTRLSTAIAWLRSKVSSDS